MTLLTGTMNRQAPMKTKGKTAQLVALPSEKSVWRGARPLLMQDRSYDSGNQGELRTSTMTRAAVCDVSGQQKARRKDGPFRARVWSTLRSCIDAPEFPRRGWRSRT